MKSIYSSLELPFPLEPISSGLSNVCTICLRFATSQILKTKKEPYF